MAMNKVLLGFAMILLASELWANEPVLRIESTITGNQEQPKVMSILPWQDAEKPEFFAAAIEMESTIQASDIEGIESATDQAQKTFNFIDRDSFTLELKYINATKIK